MATNKLHPRRSLLLAAACYLRLLPHRRTNDDCCRPPARPPPTAVTSNRDIPSSCDEPPREVFHSGDRGGRSRRDGGPRVFRRCTAPAVAVVVVLFGEVEMVVVLLVVVRYVQNAGSVRSLVTGTKRSQCPTVTPNCRASPRSVVAVAVCQSI